MSREAEVQTHLSIRDPEHLKTLSCFPMIRVAIIALYDYFEKTNVEPETNQRDLQADRRFPKSLVSESVIKQYFHLLSRMMCNIAAYLVGKYLETHFPGRFDAFMIQAADGDLKYFVVHYELILFSHSDKKWLALSPSNIFNPAEERMIEVPDQQYVAGNTPVYRGQPFIRSTDVLVADSYSQLIDLLRELEGGRWTEELELNEFKLSSYDQQTFYRGSELLAAIAHQVVI